MKIKVAIVDSNATFRKTLTGYFLGQRDIEVVGEAANGMDGCRLIEKCLPDIVLLDTVLAEVDGFGVLTFLQNKGLRTRAIVISSFQSDHIVNRCVQLGATYFMVKPVDCNLVLDRMRELYSDEHGVKNFDAEFSARLKQVHNRTLEEKITNVFMMVGIPPQIKGYQYLREGIKISTEHPEIINSITKQLYPTIAQHFETTASKVERAIRHAIEVAWNRGRIENINNLFGVKIYTKNDKPTNGEFIALVADKMLLEGV